MHRHWGEGAESWSGGPGPSLMTRSSRPLRDPLKGKTTGDAKLSRWFEKTVRGGPSGSRTPNLLIKSQLLYQLS